ncbi:MAG: cbb3-type cytochrome oxidase assembly protein CcoS [Phycisphaerales bacterium]|nr:cbb3-type cytochrome oxidase assembly protein CcoS [Phycisphaerales bacterium]
MELIFIILPLALVLAAVFIGAFVWAARSGQMDDMDSPAGRAVFDDEPGSGGAPRDAE